MRRSTNRRTRTLGRTLLVSVGLMTALVGCLDEGDGGEPLDATVLGSEVAFTSAVAFATSDPADGMELLFSDSPITCDLDRSVAFSGTRVSFLLDGREARSYQNAGYDLRQQTASNDAALDGTGAVVVINEVGAATIRGSVSLQADSEEGNTSISGDFVITRCF